MVRPSAQAGGLTARGWIAAVAAAPSQIGCRRCGAAV